VVGLLNFPHFLFSGCYSVRISKRFLQLLDTVWKIAQPYRSVLPDVQQNLASGYTHQVVECLPHLRLFVWNAGWLE